MISLKYRVNFFFSPNNMEYNGRTFHHKRYSTKKLSNRQNVYTKTEMNEWEEGSKQYYMYNFAMKLNDWFG